MGNLIVERPEQHPRQLRIRGSEFWVVPLGRVVPSSVSFNLNRVAYADDPYRVARTLRPMLRRLDDFNLGLPLGRFVSGRLTLPRAELLVGWASCTEYSGALGLSLSRL